MNRNQLRIILYVLGFLATISLFILAIYWFFIRTPEAVNENVSIGNINGLPNVNAADFNVNTAVNENANAALPNVNAGTFADLIARGGETQTQAVTEDATIAPVLASNSQDLLYYDAADDRFYRRSADGRTQTLLADEAFPEVESVTWAPTKDKAVITFPDKSKIFYDFAHQTKATLPRELAEVSFSPQGDKLAAKYIGPTADDSWLTVSNPDGSGAAVLEKLGENADLVDVNWSPNSQVVATFHHGNDLSTEEVLFVGNEGQSYPSVIVPGLGFSGTWSADGRQILYSVYSGDTRDVPALYMMDASGDSFGTNHKSLRLETWADKCTFALAGTSVYCAVPTYLPAGAGTSREIAAGIPDDFYRIDLVSGRAERIARPVDSRGLATITAENLLVSPDEGTLYYTSAGDGRVYSMRLQ